MHRHPAARPRHQDPAGSARLVRTGCRRQHDENQKGLMCAEMHATVWGKPIMLLLMSSLRQTMRLRWVVRGGELLQPERNRRERRRHAGLRGHRLAPAAPTVVDVCFRTAFLNPLTSTWLKSCRELEPSDAASPCACLYAKVRRPKKEMPGVEPGLSELYLCQNPR